MSSSAASKNAILRDAFTATATKEKGPPAADGILSITPDAPDEAEWRRNALDVAETTSTYLDDDDDGPKPNELYGKFTWKIENFSEISKRELRSNVFDVGNYKWYILVYPQGCDVCNHLSLFLCVADYDKLLPGWSHFAQFTIAVVNKDPKKSKYSDTLHRFCKKEHDWGWKKFMELSKVLDGFTHNDTLIIKAQVQVIIDKPSRPFRCLDPQYRRELVRVYLTNVEGVCRRFCEDKKSKLGWVRDEIERFKSFWLGLSKEAQRKLLSDKAEGILKGLVKQFFNEKEVTSTLVMDALFSGLKQAEEHSRSYSEGKGAGPDGPPLVLIKPERNTFSLHGDLLEVAERVNKDFIPAPKDEKPLIAPNDGLTLRSGQEDDYRRDSIERDEKRLAELGRKTVEMFAIGYIISERMEVAYRDAEALKRQDQLIAEEFETQKLEETKAKAQAEKEKEKKAKKKEKVKAKKDAEKAKKDEEEAEKKKLDDAKRLEQERKALEVVTEKKRQEDETAKARQQAAAKQATASKQSSSSQEQKAKQGNTKASGGDKPSINSAQAAPSSRPVRSSLGSSLELGTDGFEDADSMSGGGPRGPGSEVEDVDDPGDAGGSVAGDKGAGASHELTASGESSAPGSTRGAVGTMSLGQTPDHEDEEEEEEEDPDDDDVDGTSDYASATANGIGSIDRVSADDLPSSAERLSVSALLSTNAQLEQEVVMLKGKVYSLEKMLADRDAEVSTLQARLSEVNQSSAQTRSLPKQPFTASSSSGVAGSVKPKDFMSNGGKEAPQPPPPPPPAPSQNPIASARRPPGTFEASNATSASVAASAAVNGRASAPPPAAPPPLQQQNRSTSLGGPSGFMAPSNSAHQQPQGGRLRVNSETSAASVAVAAAAASAAVSGGRPSLTNISQPQTTAAAAAQQFAANQQAAAAAGIQHPNHGSSNDGMGVSMGQGPPSYRNAAAGVVLGSSTGVTVNAPSAHLQQQQQQQSSQGQPRTTTTSITPPATPKSNGGVNEGGPLAVSTGGHLSHTATEFSSNHRLVMQQQASFGQQQQQQAQAKRAMQAHPMDSPGLDDFAHMGLIDDLLTE